MYQENALFHHMVESFARMLPAMVDGMAEHAAREETSLHGTIERLRSGLAAYSTSAVCRNCGEPITYADGIWTHAKDRIPCDWVRFCGDGPWWQQQGSGTMAIDLYPHAKAQP